MNTVTIPGWGTLQIRHIVLDLNGTITESGEFIPGVLDALRNLHRKGYSVFVLSADTRRNLKERLGRFPEIGVRITETGQAKRALVESLGPESTICIGNGNIDVDMFKVARLSICTIQGEGATVEALTHADIVVTHVKDAIELVHDEQRLIATLRR